MFLVCLFRCHRESVKTKQIIRLVKRTVIAILKSRLQAFESEQKPSKGLFISI